MLVCVCIRSGKSLSFWYRLEKSGATEGIFCVSVAQVQGLVSFSHMLSNLSRLEVLLHRTSFQVFVCLVWWDSTLKAAGSDEQWVSQRHCPPWAPSPCPRAGGRWAGRVFASLKDVLLHIVLLFLVRWKCQVPVHCWWRKETIDCCPVARGEKHHGVVQHLCVVGFALFCKGCVIFTTTFSFDFFFLCAGSEVSAINSHCGV